MNAIQLLQPGQIALVDVPIPTPGERELLIRTGAAIICTSDIHDMRENPFGIPLPVVIGHEAAGIVAALGAGVQGFAIGDRVATHPVHSCGECSACAAGSAHLCQKMEHFGINLPGTMAEYYRVRVDRARHIPETMPFGLAALAEPVSVCLEALAQARVQPGQSLLIAGDGPFGLMMERLAGHMGLSRVVISGMEAFRLGFARHAARVNLQGVSDPVAALLSASGGSGYDAAILAVSSAEAFQQALRCLKPKGRLVVFSALPGNTAVDLFSVHVQELEIIGACNDQDRFDDAVQRLADPTIGLEALITHTFPIQQYRQAFTLAEHGKAQALKVAFTFPVDQP